MEVAIERRSLVLRVALRYPLGIALLALAVVAPAGTFHFWQGWLFVSIVVLSSTIVLIWLSLRAPTLLDRRMRMKEKERQQKRLIVPGWILALTAFAFPAVDRRFGWSSVPVPIVIAADVLVVAAYGLFVLVLRENRWASRVVEVEQGQTVVTTGPYAVVRHPLYAAAAVIYGVTPLALGSWWGLLLVPPLAAILVLRISNEERVLRRDLEGYEEYSSRVRYRIIPGIW